MTSAMREFTNRGAILLPGMARGILANGPQAVFFQIKAIRSQRLLQKARTPEDSVQWYQAMNLPHSAGQQGDFMFNLVTVEGRERGL